MIKDIKESNWQESFSMRVYHRLVAMTMRDGFRWTRLTRYGNSLYITNLRHGANVKHAVAHKDIIERYERWHKWMLSNAGERQ